MNHQSSHKMQSMLPGGLNGILSIINIILCIFLQLVFEGKSLFTGFSSSLSCPLCYQSGFSEFDLTDHVTDRHGGDSRAVVYFILYSP